MYVHVHVDVFEYGVFMNICAVIEHLTGILFYFSSFRRIFILLFFTTFILSCIFFVLLF